MSSSWTLRHDADTLLSEIESEDEEMIGLKRKKNSNVQTQTHEYTGHPIEEDEEEVTKPSTSAKSFEVKFSGHTYQHHQFMLIYATECGIGHTSYEYIFSNLRSTRARSNMTKECVNPDERCDGDHCFHRLMLISNSIYFCFPMDHTTNRSLSVHRKKARDWNYTLAQREYGCGN